MRGDWTRAVAVRAVAADASRAARRCPGRSRRRSSLLSATARLRSGRARSPGCCASWSSAARAIAGGRFHAEFVDPDRDPQRAEAASRRYGIGAYEMGQGAIVFTSGDALEGRDLGGPGRAGAGRRGRAEPGAARLARRGGVRVRAADGHQRRSVRICFSAGHGEPDIESPAGRRLRDVRGGAAPRRRRGARAVARVGDAALARLPRAGGGRADAGVLAAGDRGAEAVRGRRRAAAGDAGPGVQRATARRSRTSAWRTFARRGTACGWATTWSSIRRAPATSRDRRCGRPGRRTTGRTRSRRASAGG